MGYVRYITWKLVRRNLRALTGAINILQEKHFKGIRVFCPLLHVLINSNPSTSVTENTAAVRGSVTPLPVLIYRGFLPINLQLTRASKHDSYFATTSHFQFLRLS